LRFEGREVSPAITSLKLVKENVIKEPMLLFEVFKKLELSVEFEKERRQLIVPEITDLEWLIVQVKAEFSVKDREILLQREDRLLTAEHLLKQPLAEGQVLVAKFNFVLKCKVFPEDKDS